jgi:hypothetical protein
VVTGESGSGTSKKLIKFRRRRCAPLKCIGEVCRGFKDNNEMEYREITILTRSNDVVRGAFENRAIARFGDRWIETRRLEYRISQDWGP